MMDQEKAATTRDTDVVYVASQRVSCKGIGGALGHPLVWYSLEDGEAVCGYCDRKFVYAPEKA